MQGTCNIKKRKKKKEKRKKKKEKRKKKKEKRKKKKEKRKKKTRISAGLGVGYVCLIL